MTSYILAIDQGTTSSRAVVFDHNINVKTIAQQEFPQHYPHPGWVEHQPKDIVDTVHNTCQKAIQQANIKPQDIAAIGITNQRETTLIWDTDTGQTIYPAIVWQDRRTSQMCEHMRQQGYEATITEKTGLLLDPYFSATKIKWILDHVQGAYEQAKAGKLAFGTVDSYLVWHLTKGQCHITDATNAARTMLYNIHKGEWDRDICAAFNIPMTILPQVHDCNAHFGVTDFLGANTPILGIAGDQQAATIGQACFEPNMIKATYGTGCFLLLNTGNTMIPSQNRLLSTIAYQFYGQTTYAIEGSIFIAGAAVQWLRDELNIIATAQDSDAYAQQSDCEQNIVLVPAFTGLGAPYWQAECRGAVFGLTRNSGRAELVRATLESIGFQTRDLIQAMAADTAKTKNVQSAQQWQLRADGGMANSDWTMQFLADITNGRIDRPKIVETTALGVAWVAGMHAGIYPTQAEFAKTWQLEKQFVPHMDATTRQKRYAIWQAAIQSVINMHTNNV